MDVCPLGNFVHGTVLSIGTFCQFSCFGYWAILAIGLFCSLGSFGYCARPLGHFCHQAIFAIKPFMGHLGPWAVWALGPFEPPAIAPGHWAVFAIRPFWPSSRLWAVWALGPFGPLDGWAVCASVTFDQRCAICCNFLSELTKYHCIELLDIGFEGYHQSSKKSPDFGESTYLKSFSVRA